MKSLRWAIQSNTTVICLIDSSILGASQFDPATPGDYIDRAISAFGFDRILYESNWFVNDAMGDTYDKTAQLLYDGCKRAGATAEDLRRVFHDNACKV